MFRLSGVAVDRCTLLHDCSSSAPHLLTTRSGRPHHRLQPRHITQLIVVTTKSTMHFSAMCPCCNKMTAHSSAHSRNTVPAMTIDSAERRRDRRSTISEPLALRSRLRATRRKASTGTPDAAAASMTCCTGRGAGRQNVTANSSSRNRSVARRASMDCSPWCSSTRDRCFLTLPPKNVPLAV